MVLSHPGVKGTTMLDNLTARARHFAFALLGAVLGALLPLAVEPAPELIGMGVAHLPQPWSGILSPFVGAIAAAVVAELTAITRQYGRGEDTGSDVIDWNAAAATATRDVDPEQAPRFVELPDPRQFGSPE